MSRADLELLRFYCVTHECKVETAITNCFIHDTPKRVGLWNYLVANQVAGETPRQTLDRLVK